MEAEVEEMIDLIYLFIIVLLIGIVIFRLQILEKIIDISIFVVVYSILEWVYGVEDIMTKILISITAFIISVLLRKLLMANLKSRA